MVVSIRKSGARAAEAAKRAEAEAAAVRIRNRVKAAKARAAEAAQAAQVQAKPVRTAKTQVAPSRPAAQDRPDKTSEIRDGALGLAGTLGLVKTGAAASASAKVTGAATTVAAGAGTVVTAAGLATAAAVVGVGAGVLGVFSGPSRGIKDATAASQAMAEGYAAQGFDVTRGNLGQAKGITETGEGITRISHKGVPLLDWTSDGAFLPNTELVPDRSVRVGMNELVRRAESLRPGPERPVGDPILIPGTDGAGDTTVRALRSGGVTATQDGTTVQVQTDPFGIRHVSVTAPDGSTERFAGARTAEGTTWLAMNGDTMTVLHDAKGNFLDGDGKRTTEAMVRFSQKGENNETTKRPEVGSDPRIGKTTKISDFLSGANNGGITPPGNNNLTASAADEPEEPEGSEGTENSFNGLTVARNIMASAKQSLKTLEKGAQLTLTVAGAATVWAAGLYVVVGESGRERVGDSISNFLGDRQEDLNNTSTSRAFQEQILTGSGAVAAENFTKELIAANNAQVAALDRKELPEVVSGQGVGLGSVAGLTATAKNLKTAAAVQLGSLESFKAAQKGLVDLYPSNAPAEFIRPLGLDPDKLERGEYKSTEIQAAIDEKYGSLRDDLIDAYTAPLIVAHYLVEPGLVNDGVAASRLIAVQNDLAQGETESFRALFKERIEARNAAEGTNADADLPALDRLVKWNGVTGDFDYARENPLSPAAPSQPGGV